MLMISTSAYLCISFNVDLRLDIVKLLGAYLENGIAADYILI